MGGLYLKSEVMWREAAVRRDTTSHLLCATLAVGAAPAKARSSGFAAAWAHKPGLHESRDE